MQATFTRMRCLLATKPAFRMHSLGAPSPLLVRHFSAGTLAEGKHKGQTYEHVLATDPGYCKWVLNLTSPKAAMQPFVDFLKAQKEGGASGGGGSESQEPQGSASTSNASGNPFGSGSDTIGFGKHKGKTYDQMEQQEADYCRWLVKNAKENPSKPPNNFVKYLMAKNGDSMGNSSPPRSSGSSGGSFRSSGGGGGGGGFRGGGGGGGFAPRPKLNADGLPLKNGDWVCNFGKHSGLTFAQIYEKDRSYLQWFVKTTLEDTKTPRAESLALALYAMHRDGQQGGKRF